MRGVVLVTASFLLACVGDEHVGTVSKDAGSTTEAGGLPSSKLVFLSAQPQNASELKDLTRVCTADLQRHGRGGGFAWAQDASGKSPATRLGAYNGPWVLPSGAIVFATKADITGGTGAATGINESLEGPIGERNIWTAVDKSGAPKVGMNCGGWDDSRPESVTSGTSTGVVGPTWADDGSGMNCHSQNYLICFEN